MPPIVSPEGINYVITDVNVDGPDLAALKGRRSDLPPLKNVHQLFGWTQAPHGYRAKVGDWQLLKDVRWAVNAADELIPLIGSAKNALKEFNRYNGTSFILDARFRKLMSGARAFEGWTRLPEGQLPEEVAGLRDGRSLFGLRDKSQLHEGQPRLQVRRLAAFRTPTFSHSPPPFHLHRLML